MDAEHLTPGDEEDALDECSSKHRRGHHSHMHRVKRVWDNLCLLEDTSLN